MSDTRRYIFRKVRGGKSEFPYDVIDTRDDDRVVLASVSGTVIIDVTEAMNAAYEQGRSDVLAETQR